MTRPRYIPTSDVEQVKQWRKDNERELRWAVSRIALVEAKLTELECERLERLAARVSYDEKISALEGEDA